MPTFENLVLSLDGHILQITVNREAKLNALNHKTLDEIEAAFDYVYQTPEVRAVIVTGAGPKAFVAGADIAEIAQISTENAAYFAERGQRIFAKIENCTKPVVAAVNGFALGGGCELAMACHFRVASDNARFGLPEVNLGIIPGYGGTQRLPLLVGRGRAIEMMLTADFITAAQAHQYGLVNHVTAPDELLPKCKEILTKMLAKGPLAVSYALQAVNALYQHANYAAEAQAFGACCQSGDFKEGTAAFLEKRTANFSGK